MFAEASRSVRAIASPTSSGTCEPPGASRNTKPPSPSDEKRARAAWTSSTVAAMDRAYPRLILGCGNFGGIGSSPAFFGQGETKEQAFELMDAAWELDLRRFDTADAYGGGRSEQWIGDWLRATGNRPRVTSKTFNAMEDGADHGLARERVLRQVETSLERLGIDRIDLYLTHEPDPDTPVEETYATFQALLERGSIGTWGVSNVGPADLREWLELGTPSLVQNSYSLLDRGDETEVIPLCAEHGIPYQAFSPLAGGWLTGKYRRGEEAPLGSRMTMRPEPYRHL